MGVFSRENIEIVVITYCFTHKEPQDGRQQKDAQRTCANNKTDNVERNIELQCLHHREEKRVQTVNYSQSVHTF